MKNFEKSKKLLESYGYRVIKESEENNPLFAVVNWLNMMDFEYFDEIEEAGVVRVNGTDVGDIEISYNDNPNYSEGVGYYVADDDGKETYFDNAEDLFGYVCSILESKKVKKGKMIKESLDDTDDDDLKAAITELANETGNDIEDVEIDEKSDCTRVTFGDEEYMLFDDYDNAEEKAIQFCEDLLDDTGIEGIRFEYLGGIEKFVDEDWFRRAFEEMAELTIDELDDEELEDQYDTNDPEEAKEKYLENYSDDYIQAYIDVFGEREFNEVIVSQNLVDFSELAKAIVDADGVGNSLASYDGEEIELSNGYYAYRTN